MKTICAGLACLFIGSTAFAVVNVSFSTSAVSLQSEFIETTTTQYLGSVVKSPYFVDTYQLKITGKKTTPPRPENPIPTATAVDQCMAYGFSDGQVHERGQTLEKIDNFWTLCDFPQAYSQGPEFSSGTCKAVLRTIYNSVYQQNYSTPTVNWR